MLPFSRILEYGNEVVHKDWYDGVDLLAYDSSIYNSSGFVDYTGKNVSSFSTVYGVAGSLPTKGTQTGFDYGTGINLNRGSIGAASTQISTSYLPNNWMVDFWVKFTTVGGTVNDYLPFFPLMNDNNGSGRAYEFQSSNTGTNNGTLGMYYNNGSVGTWVKNTPTYLTQFRDANWHHFSIQYTASSQTVNVYIDGVVVIQWTGVVPIAVSPTTHNGFIWGNYQGRSSSTCCIERYRLRTGNYVPSALVGEQAFTPDSTTLYPGT